jgi:hypothetical protein
VVDDFLEHQLKNLANVAPVPRLVGTTHTVYYAGDTTGQHAPLPGVPKERACWPAC